MTLSECAPAPIDAEHGEEIALQWRLLHDEARVVWEATIGMVRLSMSAAMEGGGSAYSSEEQSLAVARAVDGAWTAIERYETALERRDEQFANLLAAGQPSVDFALVRRLDLTRLRERRSAILELPTGLPMAAIDIESIFESECGIGRVAECERVEMLLREHAVELTTLRARWHRLTLENYPRDLRAFHEHRGDHAAFIADRRARGGAIVRIERAIIEANERWLDRLAVELSDECVAGLNRKYREAAYPEVHPCPLDIGRVVEAVHELPAGRLPEEDRARLDRVIESTIANVEELRRRLERLVLDRAEVWALTRTRRVDGTAEREFGRVRRQQAAAVNELLAFMGSLGLADELEEVPRLRGVVATVIESSPE